MSKDLIVELFYHLGNKFRLYISFSTGLFYNMYHTSVALLLRQQFCRVLLFQQVLWAWMPINLPSSSFFFFPLHPRLPQTTLNFPLEKQAETLKKCKREKKKNQYTLFWKLSVPKNTQSIY